MSKVLPIPALCSVTAPTLPGEVVAPSLLPACLKHTSKHIRGFGHLISCICMGRAGPGSSAQDWRLNATFLEHGDVLTHSLWKGNQFLGVCKLQKAKTLQSQRDLFSWHHGETRYHDVIMYKCYNGWSSKVNLVCTELVASALRRLWCFKLLSKITTEFLKWGYFQKHKSNTLD